MSAPRPGRRIAETPHRTVDPGSVVALVLVVLAVGLGFLAGSGTVSGADTGSRSGVLVDHAVHGCPRFTPPRGTSTTVVTGSAPVDDLGSAGSLRHGATGKDLASAKPLTPRRGQLVRIDPGSGTSTSTVVDAAGDLAAGLFTFQEDTGRDNTTAVAECESPASSSWFTGAGATLDHSSALVLSNVDPGPAVVDIRFLGPDGAIESIGTRGLTVPPESQRTISLTDVAPQGKKLAVSVVTSRGRVVAAMSDSFAPQFGANTGEEWLPPQTSASRVVRLAGIPGKADSQELSLANPSELEALVNVRVSGASGAFTPTSGATVRVPPGAVVTTDLTRTVGKEPAAVVLRSTVPVTGSIRSVARGDTAYAGSVRPLTDPAVAPVPSGGTSTVQLTAGSQAASADVTAYDGDGRRLESTTLDIQPGATATWSPKKKTAAYLMVTPRTGRVFGATTFAGASGSSAVPLRPLTIRVEQPSVSPAFR